MSRFTIIIIKEDFFAVGFTRADARVKPDRYREESSASTLQFRASIRRLLLL